MKKHGQKSKNKSNWRKAASALFAITVAAFTAAYAFNLSPRALAHSVFGASTEAVRPAPAFEERTAFQKINDKTPDLSSAALASGTLTAARRGHTATRLDDGDVLIAGGDAGGTFEIFDPALGTPSDFGNLTTSRSGHTATKLADGRVLLTGGISSGAAVSSTEIYDPAAGAFAAGAAMSAARSGHTATVLADGRILVAGGDANGSAEIYDAATGSFTALEALMSAARAGHSAVLMNDGRVFLVGGSRADGEELSSAEIFDPADSTFSAVGSPLAHPRTQLLLRVLPDGKVQIIGGNDDASMEIYDPAADVIGAHGHLIPTNDEHDALMMFDILNAPTRAALFHHDQTDALVDRTDHSITELDDRALVAGGTNTAGQILNTLSVLDSSGATVTTDRLDYQPGQTAVITGNGWQAGETVDIVLHEDPHTHTERRLSAAADENGNFTANYPVEAHDLRMTFVVGVKGRTSGRTAQTTFTDASPGSLGNYATAGLSGTIAPSVVAPSNVAANVAFSNLSRGAGITPVAAADAFNSSSWQVTPSLTIPGNTDYYEFTVTPNSCYQFSLSELRIGLQRSGTGPQQVELRSSLDSYAARIGSIMNPPQSPTTTTFSINLSGVSGLQDQASPVTFRLYGYSAGSATGTLRIQRVTSVPMVGLEVDGTVTGSGGALSVTTDPTDQTTVFGGSATFTAAADGSTGVQWQVSADGGANFSDLGGETNASLTVSNVALSQNGNRYRAAFSNSCAAATSNPATLSVGKRETATSMSLNGGANPSVYGDSLTFTATVSGTGAGAGDPLSGSVEFFDGAASLGTQSLAGGAASVTTSALSAGAHSITAVYSGESNFNGSASAALSQTVGKATPILTWNDPADITYGTALGAAQLDATASVAGSFNYTPASGTVLDAGSAQILHVDFTPTDTANYNNASKDVSINVLKADATIDVSGYTGVYDGAAHGATGTATGAGGADLSGLLNLGASFTDVPGGTADWSFAGSNNYKPANGTASIVITKAISTTVVSGGGTYLFDNLPHPATVSVTGAGGLNLSPAPVYSGNCSAPPVTVAQTPCTASYTYPGDNNHAGSSGSTTINITAVSTTTSVTVSPASQQYSDKVTFTAAIAPGFSGGVAAATGVTFYVGTQAMNQTPIGLTNSGGNLTATLADAPLLEPSSPGNGQMAPGARTVKAVFSGINPNFTVGDATTPLTITPENAAAVYSGAQYFATASATSTTAQLTLSATVVDDADGASGDVRNAVVEFRRDSPAGPLLGTASPVGLVNPADRRVGTATTSFSYTLSGAEVNSNGATLTIYAVVKGYYTGASNAETVSVVIPGTDSVNGGGYLVMQSSNGQFAGLTGSKMNFGYTMKYNKSGKNLQGQANIIVRGADGRVYQIKSNAVDSLAIGSSTYPRGATFTTKANMTDITNPLAPIALGGNLTLQVEMTDAALGGQTDKVGITLWNSNGGLYFTSSWSGTKTLQLLLGGGNISVR